MNRHEKREEKFCRYFLAKTLTRGGMEPLPPALRNVKKPKGFTKKIERRYMGVVRLWVEREAEARVLAEGAWDEFDRPIGLGLT
jgi:hypothetical protein